MISFFFKQPYLLDAIGGGVYLQRVSARVRGEEIANYLKAKINPKENYENDIRIYIKPSHLDHIKAGSYVDVLDGLYGFELLKTRPDLKVIAMSLTHFEFLKKGLKNKVFLIPHHHVNFERATRKRKKIITCGYVGVSRSNHFRINNKVKVNLEKIGFKFKPLLNYQTRQDIINYYKTIDLQIIGYFDFYKDSPYRHPTKIINAASFGIPTIAGPVLGFKEMEGYYVPTGNMEALLAAAQEMRDQKYYNRWSAKVKKEAEKYHISNIVKLYQQLI